MGNAKAGDRVGEYVLREKLGEGGFGVVWKAENPDLPGKLVAIKFPSSERAARSLRVEATAQHRLQHPRIVKTLSLNLKHDPPYVVLEFIDGRSLRHHLKSGRQLAERELLRIASDILEGCAYAHGKNVIHGDISPSNVLIDMSGRAHLTDFGLSQDLSSANETLSISRSTSQGSVQGHQGTLRYVAPELRDGGRKSKSSDVFALGLLLLEMLTNDPVYLRFPIIGAPKWLSDLIERATARLPGSRFGDAGEMLVAFQTDAVSGSAKAFSTDENNGSAPHGSGVSTASERATASLGGSASSVRRKIDSLASAIGAALQNSFAVRAADRIAANADVRHAIPPRRCPCGGIANCYHVTRYMVNFVIPAGTNQKFRCSTCGRTASIGSPGVLAAELVFSVLVLGLGVSLGPGLLFVSQFDHGEKLLGLAMLAIALGSVCQLYFEAATDHRELDHA